MANIQMILQALEQPNVEVSELIAQLKDHYQSKLLSFQKKKYMTISVFLIDIISSPPLLLPSFRLG